MTRRDPPRATFDAAVKYLEEQGFKLTHHTFGPKRRIDLGWPDDRRGIRLPEWRVVEIAEAWKKQSDSKGAAPKDAPGDPPAGADQGTGA